MSDPTPPPKGACVFAHTGAHNEPFCQDHSGGLPSMLCERAVDALLAERTRERDEFRAQLEKTVQAMEGTVSQTRTHGGEWSIHFEKVLHDARRALAAKKEGSS